MLGQWFLIFVEITTKLTLVIHIVYEVRSWKFAFQVFMFSSNMNPFTLSSSKHLLTSFDWALMNLICLFLWLMLLIRLSFLWGVRLIMHTPNLLPILITLLHILLVIDHLSNSLLWIKFKFKFKLFNNLPY